MTQQDDIIQRVLTDEEIQDIADGFDIYGAKPEFARAIESALLSKLRAPVADSTLPLEQALHELVDKIVPGLDTGDLVQDARRASTALSAILASAPVADERAALAKLLEYVDRNTCTHEDTHRGGAIWTICDGCGMKWADDEGGFVPHQDAPAVAAARAALASAPVADERSLQAWAERFPEICDMERLRDAWNDARASAPVAGEAVYTLSVKGVFHNWKPTTAAFSIPDGEHQLFLRPAAPQASTVAREAQKPVAWMLIGRLKNSEPKFTLSDPAGIYESVYAPLYAAPQASDTIGLLRKAAEALAGYRREMSLLGPVDIQPCDAERAIVAALKPQADKDGGQQLSGNSGQLDSAKGAGDDAGITASEDHIRPDLDRGFPGSFTAFSQWVMNQPNDQIYVHSAQEGFLAGVEWCRQQGIGVCLPEYLNDLRYHDQYRVGWNRCVDAYRAALSAPQAEQGERDA